MPKSTTCADHVLVSDREEVDNVPGSTAYADHILVRRGGVEEKETLMKKKRMKEIDKYNEKSHILISKKRKKT